MHHTSRGITLIELLISLTIIGILSAIVYPSYQQYLQQVRRSDGRIVLMEMMARQQRYYLDHNSYTVELRQLGYPQDHHIQSQEGHYRVSATACEPGLASCVQLTARPQGIHSHDAPLTLDSLSRRSGPW